jgi:hypothetical protein
MPERQAWVPTQEHGNQNMAGIHNTVGNGSNRFPTLKRAIDGGFE